MYIEIAPRVSNADTAAGRPQLRGPVEALGVYAAARGVHIDRPGHVSNNDTATGGGASHRGFQVAHIEITTRCPQLYRIVTRYVDREVHAPLSKAEPVIPAAMSR